MNFDQNEKMNLNIFKFGDKCVVIITSTRL